MTKNSDEPETPQEEPEYHTVFLVHGTFDAPNLQQGPKWYEPGSAFVARLDAALAKTGSNARCWSHLGKAPDRSRIYSWSGANSWADRQDAAEKLAEAVLPLLGNEYTRCHIVAHSHGGNIVHDALRILEGKDDRITYRHIGNIVFLGTPFLHGVKQPWQRLWMAGEPQLGLRRLDLMLVLLTTLGMSLVGIAFLPAFLTLTEAFSWWIKFLMITGISVATLLVSVFLISAMALERNEPRPFQLNRLLLLNSKEDEVWLLLGPGLDALMSKPRRARSSSILADIRKGRALRRRAESLMYLTPKYTAVALYGVALILIGVSATGYIVCNGGMEKYWLLAGISVAFVAHLAVIDDARSEAGLIEILSRPFRRANDIAEDIRSFFRLVGQQFIYRRLPKYLKRVALGFDNWPQDIARIEVSLRPPQKSFALASNMRNFLRRWLANSRNCALAALAKA